MIPNFQKLMRPVLASVKDGPKKISEVVEEVVDKFALNEDERKKMLPSGKQTIIANRTHWAKSYLKQAGLVRNMGSGWYEITDRGRDALAKQDIEINTDYLERFDEYQEFKSRGKDSTEEQDINDETDDIETPDESLQIAHKKLVDALAKNLLDSIRDSTPRFFEHLIVDLFLAMGYGGSTREAGRAIGQTGDGGVDGVIDQDVLGVDQIYIQAKRYKADNKIGSSHIRDFFGALNIKKASKGIFVTTSSFTESADQTRKDLGSRIVFIDGSELAYLLIRYNIGCREKDVLRIKEIDEAYFDDTV